MFRAGNAARSVLGMVDVRLSPTSTLGGASTIFSMKESRALIGRRLDMSTLMRLQLCRLPGVHARRQCQRAAADSMVLSTEPAAGAGAEAREEADSGN